MKYSQEVRSEVKDCFQEHLSVSSIVQTFKIPYQTVYKWKQEYLENLKPDEQSYLQKILYLKRRVDKLERELAVWKECRANKSSSIEEKVKEVQRLGSVYGVHAVCRILDLRRSNYYHHTLRSPEITQIKAEDERLKPIVASIFEETKHRIGPDKIRILILCLPVTDGIFCGMRIFQVLQGHHQWSALIHDYIIIYTFCLSLFILSYEMKKGVCMTLGENQVNCVKWVKTDTVHRAGITVYGSISC